MTSNDFHITLITSYKMRHTHTSYTSLKISGPSDTLSFWVLRFGSQTFPSRDLSLWGLKTEMCVFLYAPTHLSRKAFKDVYQSVTRFLYFCSMKSSHNWQYSKIRLIEVFTNLPCFFYGEVPDWAFITKYSHQFSTLTSLCILLTCGSFSSRWVHCSSCSCVLHCALPSLTAAKKT